MRPVEISSRLEAYYYNLNQQDNLIINSVVWISSMQYEKYTISLLTFLRRQLKKVVVLFIFGDNMPTIAVVYILLEWSISCCNLSISYIESFSLSNCSLQFLYGYSWLITSLLLHSKSYFQHIHFSYEFSLTFTFILKLMPQFDNLLILFFYFSFCSLEVCL